MSKIEKIVLHIGPYKTGSTTIQRTSIENNSQLLNDFGILYPSFHYDHGPLFRNAFKRNPENLHNNLIENKSLEKIKEDVKKSLNHMENEISQTNPDILFISGEHISDLDMSELEALKNYLLNFCNHIEVYYFVRDPMKLILSDLQESVKTGRATLHDWSFNYIIPRYYEKIKAIERVFGTSSTKVLHFESAIKSDVGFVRYFFQNAFSIEVDVDKEQKSNDSISDLSFKLIEKLNISEPSILNGKRNQGRSGDLVKLLKSHKGSPINVSLPLPQSFISKLNKNLLLLDRDYSISYQPLSFNESKSEVMEVNNTDMQSFVDLLNIHFIEQEKSLNEITNLLRDSAITLENIDLDLATKLMSKANELRPNGPFIKKKLEEYDIKAKNNE